MTISTPRKDMIHTHTLYYLYIFEPVPLRLTRSTPRKDMIHTHTHTHYLCP